MKIGFISQWYPPERSSAALPGVQAAALAAAGHEVKVVTGFPNFPDGEILEPYSQRLHQREVIDGVEVHRSPQYVSHDRRAIRRMANYWSFALSSTATSIATLRDVDAVWVHSTPATVALPAMVLRTFGIPYVLHIQDLWPDTVTASGFMSPRLSSIAEKVLHPFCDAAYRMSHSVQVISPGMRERIAARGIAEDKLGFLPNWCDESVFFPRVPSDEVRQRAGLSAPFTVMYAGAMGDVQGLDTVIDAAELLRARPEIEFVLIGSGVQREMLTDQCRLRGLNNVRFLPAQPISSMGDLLAEADMQLICLRDLPLYKITVPSKVQASMAMGVPLLVSAGGDAARVVTDAKAGLAAQPGSASDLAKATVEAFEAGPDQRRTWGRNARAHYRSQFGQDIGVAAMVAALERAEDSRRRRIGRGRKHQ